MLCAEKSLIKYNNNRMFLINNSDIFDKFQTKEGRMNEKRKIDRIPLVYYISVFEKDSSVLLGYLSDINTDSAQIVTEKCINVNDRLSLKIETISEELKGRYIEVNSKCTRCTYDNKLEMYSSGVTFDAVDVNAIEEIERIAEKLVLISESD